MVISLARQSILRCAKYTCHSSVFAFPNLYSRTYYKRSRTFSSSAMSSAVKIGTHDGVFHCDEALACFMLRLLPRYKDAVVIRSRDESILNTCDIVVDVGSVYDHSKLRYDHHMRDFKESISTVMKKPGYDSKIKLSSAGLIYCHYGHEIIKLLLPKDVSDTNVEHVFKKVYDTLIKEIDAVDNGIPMFDQEPLYRIVTDVSSRVAALNSQWNSGPMDMDVQFQKAINLVGEEFLSFVNNAYNVWLPARIIVFNAVKKRFEVDESGEIIELETCVPWKSHLYDIEKELNIDSQIKYVMFEERMARFIGVPLTYGSFVCRLFLPEEWAGLRDEDLERACGVEGAVFVHSVRFTGGHKTREGALAMLRKALQIGKSQ